LIYIVVAGLKWSIERVSRVLVNPNSKTVLQETNKQKKASQNAACLCF